MMTQIAATELKVENLAARRGDKILFAGLSFRLAGGRLGVLSGANGAGKSTLLRILIGLSAPFSGTAEFYAGRAGGKAPHILPRALFAHYFSEKNAMKPQLSVRQNLAFWHDFLNAETGAAQNRADNVAAALHAVKMSGYGELPFSALSTGQKRRIGFCRLLLAPRPLWLLDEPSSGLDSAGAALFAALSAQHLKRGGLILAATHLPLGIEAALNIHLADYRPKTHREQLYDSLGFAECAPAAAGAKP